MTYTVTRVSINNTMMTLHFDSGASLTLPLRIEFTSKYGIDDIIDEREFLDLQDLAMEYACKESAIRYISRSMKSRKQLCDYLKKKEFSKNHISKACLYLEEKGLIDDKTYAAEFVLSLARRKVVGRNYAEYKLQQKGIERDLARSVCDSYSSLFERDDELYELACKKFEDMKNKVNRFQKLASSLQRLGFSTAKVMSVINRMKEAGYNFNDQR